VQVTRTIRQVVSIFEREIKALDIALSIVEDVSLAEVNVDWVMLDQNRFLQILINLVCTSLTEHL
jgi:C4-dicarboxylate-specific signal transduction histidine kinase